MAKNNLTGKVKGPEKAVQETIDNTLDFGKYEIIEGYNNRHYFIRCQDKKSGRIIKEDKVSIECIVEKNMCESDAYKKIRNFIASKKCEGFGANIYALVELGKEKKKAYSGPHSLASLSHFNESIKHTHF